MAHRPGATLKLMLEVSSRSRPWSPSFSFFASAASPEGLHSPRADPSLHGLHVTVVAYGPDAPTLPSIVEAALDEVDRIDRLMSHYRPESPLSRLNREAAAGPVAVDPELFDFLAECMRYSRESEGAFDVTVGPL